MTIDTDDIKRGLPCAAAVSAATLVAACFVPAVTLLGLEAAAAGGIYAYYRLRKASNKNNGGATSVEQSEEI